MMGKITDQTDLLKEVFSRNQERKTQGILSLRL
jgi:hypothetical protein